MLIPTTFDDVRSCYHCGKAIKPGSGAFLSVATSELNGFGECDKAFHGVCYRIAEQQAAVQLNHKEGPMKLVKAIEESMSKQLKKAGKKLTSAKAKPVKADAPKPKPVNGPVGTLTVRVPGSHKNRVQKYLKAEGIPLQGTRWTEHGMAYYVVHTGRAVEDIKDGIRAKWDIDVTVNPGAAKPTPKEGPKSKAKTDVPTDGPRGEVADHQQSRSAGGQHPRPAKSGNSVAVMQAGPRRSGRGHHA